MNNLIKKIRRHKKATILKEVAVFHPEEVRFKDKLPETISSIRALQDKNNELYKVIVI